MRHFNDTRMKKGGGSIRRLYAYRFIRIPVANQARRGDPDDRTRLVRHEDYENGDVPESCISTLGYLDLIIARIDHLAVVDRNIPIGVRAQEALARAGGRSFAPVEICFREEKARRAREASQSNSWSCRFGSEGSRSGSHLTCDECTGGSALTPSIATAPLCESDDILPSASVETLL